MKVGTIKRKVFPRIFKPKITKPYNFKALFEGNGLHTLRSKLFDPKKVLQSWDPTLVPGSMLPAMLTTMLFSPSCYIHHEHLSSFTTIATVSLCHLKWVCNKRSKQETFLVDKGQPPTDPVTLTAEEKLNVTLKRDDGLSNFDVQGTLSL
ncbi:hypothetical protein L2E82_44515 [Cichorium intybus]|uniref:Uncharacterized protein n=1 Tax=Cichorium intybus TaxID=13427 RepID=A0ACB8ZQM8_CICIN|nr:hypothetical protein L2E82_44515 [Cichorium intybus]